VKTSRTTRESNRALREALAPYLDLSRLRRLAAQGDDLRTALIEGMEPPSEVLALIDTLALLLRPSEREAVRSPDDAAAFLMLQLGHLDQERLCVLCLNKRNRIQKLHTVYVGSLNASLIRVGEVFKEPLRLNSASVIVAHNHPSSQVDPSPEDILITKQIVEAGKLLSCEVLDHLIIGQGRWISMRQKGFGFEKK
jgi:DNA repair protein RadC